MQDRGLPTTHTFKVPLRSSLMAGLFAPYDLVISTNDPDGKPTTFEIGRFSTSVIQAIRPLLNSTRSIQELIDLTRSDQREFQEGFCTVKAVTGIVVTETTVTNCERGNFLWPIR